MGPNTQFIYVTNTSQLTTLDLDGVTGLIELIVNNNSMLQNVNVASLERCSRKIEFDENTALTDLNFNALTFKDDLKIEDNNALSSLNLSSLSFSRLTYVGNNIALNTISLSELSEVEYLDLSNNSLSQITLDNISSLQLLRIREPQLDNISLTNLTTVLNNIEMYAGNLNSLDLPNLTSANQISISNGSALAALNLPNLSSLQSLDVGNINTVNDLDINIPNLDTLSYIGLMGNSVSTLNLNLPMITSLHMEAIQCQINQLNLPSNVEIIDQIIMSECVLFDIDWPTGITQVNYMELFFNSIPSTEINEILSWLINLDPSTFYNCITLSGNQPPAPPTGQGITDLNTLINNNVCIDVDSP